MEFRYLIETISFVGMYLVIFVEIKQIWSIKLLEKWHMIQIQIQIIKINA